MTKTTSPTVTFWGAARTVTGSMHLVEANGKRFLLDCGLYQGKRTEAWERNSRFPFPPKSIDAVVLSHAHLDHCGNLPNLVRNGFSGPIYCTPATRDLTALMLADSAKIQEEDTAYLNDKRARNEPRLEPLYDQRDVSRTMRLVHSVPYDRVFEPVHGVAAHYVDAGHLLGSAMVALAIDGGGRERRITFTGDLGRRGLPILRDPAPVPEADLLISESTYGGKFHDPVELMADRLGEVVRKTVERGGKVVIPAFSLGRTQTVVYFLHQLMSAGKLTAVPIYVDSPLSTRTTEVYRLHSECFDDETAALLANDPDLFEDRRIHYISDVMESKKLNNRPEPCVIIASSGMCEGGRIRHHLIHTIEDLRNTILIIGFQAPETLGRKIVERRPELRILDRVLKLRAEVVVANGLSSHADQADFMTFLGPLAGKTRQVRIVHGEVPNAEALATTLREKGFSDVVIPNRGDSVTLMD